MNQTPSQKTSSTPSGLPILNTEAPKTEAHTMAQDLQKAKMKGTEDTMQMRVPQIRPNEAKPLPLEIETPSIAQAASRAIPTPPQPPITAKQPAPTTATAGSMFEKFRRPKEVSAVPETIIPDISRFKGPASIETKAPTPAIEPKATPLPKPLGVTAPIEKKLEIYIPPQKSKLPLIGVIVGIVILLAAGGGLGYWWFYIKAPAAPVGKPSIETPEVITIPPIEEPSVIKPTTPTIETPTITEVPEPETPQPTIIFDQIIITTISSLEPAELTKNLKADTNQILGDGITTRHLVKLSTKTEKRFLSAKEIFDLLDVSVPENIWQQVSNADFASYKLNNSLRYGLIAKISAKEPVLALMQSWEPKIVNDVKQLFMGEPITIPEGYKFAGNVYLDFDKRYLNLMSTETSIDYAVSNSYLILATSKDMMFATILQTQK